jgi:transcriptional regulator with XRE-family HTH domain
MANTMSDTLRSAMQASGLTDYRISRMTGVHASVIGRFLKGERGISLTTAGKIAEAVGVELR